MPPSKLSITRREPQRRATRPGVTALAAIAPVRARRHCLTGRRTDISGGEDRQGNTAARRASTCSRPAWVTLPVRKAPGSSSISR